MRAWKGNRYMRAWKGNRYLVAHKPSEVTVTYIPGGNGYLRDYLRTYRKTEESGMPERHLL